MTKIAWDARPLPQDKAEKLRALLDNKALIDILHDVVSAKKAVAIAKAGNDITEGGQNELPNMLEAARESLKEAGKYQNFLTVLEELTAKPSLETITLKYERHAK